MNAVSLCSCGFPPIPQSTNPLLYPLSYGGPAGTIAPSGPGPSGAVFPKSESVARPDAIPA